MQSVSLWRATAQSPNWPSLGSDVLTADVAIVGGGITGVTLALKLVEQGQSVVLLDAGAIGQGATGHSTGNLYETVSGGVHALTQRWDAATISRVVSSRQHALKAIQRHVEDLEIDCGWRRCPLYRYTRTPNGRTQIENEHRASLAAGISARLETTLPAGVASPDGAVLVIEDQAQLQPLGYVQALAHAASERGCRIFEHSAVQRLDRDRGAVLTEHGEVSASVIVLATHSPSGFHLVQAEMVPFQEYGIAFVASSSLQPGIFWEMDDEPLSFRIFDADSTPYLIAVGENHKTGHHDAVQAVERLEARVRRRFGVEHARYRWSAQSFQSADRLPYIGRDLSGAYIATGFGTDGLVFGTLAADVIADQILDQPNEWSELYRPGRFEPAKAAHGVVKESAAVVKELVKGYFIGQHQHSPTDLQAGEAVLLDKGRDSIGAYRDERGVLHAVSAICTHLKCKVRWNGFEKSWDCPCHGSRFTPDGKVICGPALEPLTPLSSERLVQVFPPQ